MSWFPIARHPLWMGNIWEIWAGIIDPGGRQTYFFISTNDKKGTRTLNKSVGKFAKCISPPTKEGRSALSFLRALPVNKD